MRTLSETKQTQYDANGNEVTTSSCEHEGDYDEFMIEEDAFDVILDIKSLKTMRVLVYLLHYADAGTGIINLDEKRLDEIQKDLDITRQSFLYNLNVLVKAGLILKVTEAVHMYSGYVERGTMHYMFNIDRIMKPYEGKVSDMHLERKSATDPSGKLLRSSLVVRIDD